MINTDEVDDGIKDPDGGVESRLKEVLVRLG